MRTYLSILGAVGVLSACSLMETASDNVNAAIMNKPIQAAIDSLGLPAEEKTIVGRRIIVWRTGGSKADNYACQVTAEIDASEIVRRYEIEGARGACYSWLHAVK